MRTVATPRLERLQFPFFQSLFERAFHFCDMPITLENPLMTVTRVILKLEIKSEKAEK